MLKDIAGVHLEICLGQGLGFRGWWVGRRLLKNVLLSLCGDLEAVWADAGLREELLLLPLPAMTLLLSCRVAVIPAGMAHSNVLCHHVL